jgi:hypothetical protein
MHEEKRGLQMMEKNDQPRKEVWQYEDPSDPGSAPEAASVGRRPQTSTDEPECSAMPVTFEQLETIAFAVLDLLQLIHIGHALPFDEQAQRDQLVAQACQLVTQIWHLTARQWGGALPERRPDHSLLGPSSSPLHTKSLGTTCCAGCKRAYPRLSVSSTRSYCLKLSLHQRQCDYTASG